MKMKNTLITITCFILLSTLCLSNLSAQETVEFNTKKTEVNIAVTDVFAKSNLYYPYYYIDGEGYLFSNYIYSDYFRQPALLLGVKFHNAKGAYRLSTDLQYSSLKQEGDNASLQKVTYTTFGAKLNLGYEWHSSFNRVNIYYGFDISTSISNRKIKNEYNAYNGDTKSETKITENTYGINPLLGVNVFILPNLSVGTEFKFTAEYISGKLEEESTPSNNSNGSTVSGIRTHFGPLGFLSINLHF